jgi:hypothetical protein
MKTRKEKGPNLLGIGKRINKAVGTVTNVVDTVNNLTSTPPIYITPPPPTITPPTPPTPETETETPVVDPQKEELSRQAREVMSGNVNPAQAEYFRQQNEGLFDMKERKGATKKTLNPVSNRSDGMTDVYADLYGSEESRGF